MAATFQIAPKRFDALAEVMPTTCVGEWLKTAKPAFDHAPVFRSRGSSHVAAPRPGTIPLQAIERGEADRIWNTCHGVTQWRRRIDRVQTG